MKKNLKIRRAKDNVFDLLVYYDDIQDGEERVIPHTVSGQIDNHGYVSISNLTLDDLIELKVLLARFALETKINS